MGCHEGVGRVGWVRRGCRRGLENGKDLLQKKKKLICENGNDGTAKGEGAIGKVH